MDRMVPRPQLQAPWSPCCHMMRTYRALSCQSPICSHSLQMTRYVTRGAMFAVVMSMASARCIFLCPYAYLCVVFPNARLHVCARCLGGSRRNEVL